MRRRHLACMVALRKCCGVDMTMTIYLQILVVCDSSSRVAACSARANFCVMSRFKVDSALSGSNKRSTKAPSRWRGGVRVALLAPLPFLNDPDESDSKTVGSSVSGTAEEEQELALDFLGGEGDRLEDDKDS